MGRPARPPLRRVCLAAMLAAWALIIVSCGLGDYHYPVAGDYQLWRTSRDQVFVDFHGETWGKKDVRPPRIPPKVVAVAWDERYVLAKQQPLNGEGQPIRGQYAFWILDTREHVLHGPFNEHDFVGTLLSFGIDPALQMKTPTAFIPKKEQPQE